MLDELNQSFLIKKAFELSYAIFRVGFQIRQAALKNELESWAVKVLSGVVSENYKKTQKSIEIIEYLLKLGAEVGLVNLNNVQTISSEARVLNSAIAKFSEKSAKAPEVDLEGVFSKNLSSRGELGRSEDKEKNFLDDNFSFSLNGNSSLKAAMRQSAILERIRQNNNCRLKEIQEFLPGVSERTLRYDLQSLMEQNLIERVGNGGPSTYYRLKREENQVNQKGKERSGEDIEAESNLKPEKGLLYLNEKAN